MRGTTKYQVETLFRESGINQIGESKHAAKEGVRQTSADMDKSASWHDIGQQTGIFSLSTSEDYQKVWNQILDYGKTLETGDRVKDIEKLTAGVVAGFLESKVELGVAKATFDTYAAAAEKLAAALNRYSDTLGRGNRYEFSDAIKVVRVHARIELDSTQEARAYADPRQLVACIQNTDHQLAAAIQLEANSRVREVSNITKHDLQGLKPDPRTGQIMGWYATRGKGGKHLEKMLCPGTYSKLEGHIKEHGAFRVNGDKYSESLRQAAKVSGQQYHGSHGLRWNCAQERYRELQGHGLTSLESMKVVSEELGHNRLDITMHYLRG